MVFNFDNQPDRRGMPGEKWGRYAGRDVLPLWVADMDFVIPEPIQKALSERVRHGIFGYTHPWPSLIDAVVSHLAQEYDWLINPDWLVWLPGVISGFNVACRCVGSEGDAVFTATPVYPPFFDIPKNCSRRLVQAYLTLADGIWQWDRAATQTAIDPRTRVFMLCNPHNPVGRVFTQEELRWIAELAEKRDLLICSDEIHCGLVLDKNKKHIPIATLDSQTAQRTVTLMAPSKTWNIPALYCAIAIIPNPQLRARFKHAMAGIVPEVNVLGFVAAEAAWREGEPWRRALIDYLRGNRDRVAQAVSAMPGLTLSLPEATYLAWIDCRATGIENPAEFFEQAGVGLSDGRFFGLPGFVRLNFGCTRATLDEALARMDKALRGR
ncbi:MAG: PatB family C-S lyase [Azoarcus sp.]|jgi:cystathionine beta-lyase|nr:PatB family C-S lyase [Azoarcus sp.]